jgi:hypothetical protein
MRKLLATASAAALILLTGCGSHSDLQPSLVEVVHQLVPSSRQVPEPQLAVYVRQVCDHQFHRLTFPSELSSRDQGRITGVVLAQPEC